MKFSLNRILWMMVVLVAVIAGSIAVEEAFQADRSMLRDARKTVIGKSLIVTEALVDSIEKLHRLYNQSRELDRKKLMQAVEYFDRMDRPILPILQEIRHNRLFGDYDIYLIDRNNTVRRSSFPMDVGLNFTHYPFATRVFDMVREGKIPYHASQPFYLVPSADYRNYLVARSRDGTFLIQLSHNFVPINDFHTQIRDLRLKIPEIEELTLYYISNDLFEAISEKQNLQDKRSYFTHFRQMERKFLGRYAQEMGVSIDPDRFLKDPALFRRYFLEKRIRYRIDESHRRAIVYTATENAYNDDLNKEVIIVRMVYDLSPLMARYENDYGRLVTILVFSTLLMWLLFYLIKRLIVDRIHRIVRALKRHAPIELPGPEIIEFQELSSAVEGYRKRLEQQNRELEMLALIDPLTGAGNRRFFSRVLEQMIESYRHDPIHRHFGLIILDIDDFKGVNDRYGHDVGDRVLRELAERVRDVLESGEYLFRIGGEEFAILEPAEDLESLETRAEELRRLIAKRSFGPELRITVSLGAALFEDEDNVATLYRRADTLLYHSKQTGKNRVSVRMKE